MKAEFNKVYNPQDYEAKIYKQWEESGLFNPDNLNLEPGAPSYTIILPPPNITDKLHVGHSMMLAIEDLLIRYYRLKSYRTLWLPGTDHAAIATQNVVEKKLLAEKCLSRHALGRDKFLAEVSKFVEVTQATILNQTRKMGASLDWSRLAFTLDDSRQEAVRKMFKDMYEAGVIYRGERIVNWCPRCHSTLADDEVEHKEQSAKLYTFKYGPDFPISISTTRPETKLGDTAVAVNPKDPRYQEYIGQSFKVNFVGQELDIKIIADHNVEMEFGTGALGVTPAHSLIDWQMAENNDLPVIKVINEEGQINKDFGDYAGLDAKAAGEAIILNLKAAGLLEKEEEVMNNLSVCYRCGTAIEPLPSQQWFVGVDRPVAKLGGQSLKAVAREVALNGQITFIPARFKQRYLDWMASLHDWCISRQIWFGHRIPVWYQGDKIAVGEMPASGNWEQDPDTLDTWFSSGMWTFSTLGWPESFSEHKKTGDLARFHPTQVLETGSEILTLWVSRMIMMSLFALQEIPFEKVYLHGTVLDKNGKKMSKSKGNGVDPVDMIEKYGTDALRLSLLMGSTPGNATRFSEDKAEAKRNFVNKLWNISRYILGSVSEDSHKTPIDKTPLSRTAADEWILFNLKSCVERVDIYLKNYEFSLAAEALEDFTWNKLADWYLEMAKVEKNKDEILVYLLKNVLILWHPFIPFVTEAIWSHFNDSLLMVAAWPQSNDWKDDRNSEAAELSISRVIEIIQSIRDARSQNRVEPAKKVVGKVFSPDDQDLIESQSELIKSLKTGISDLEFIKERLDDDSAIKVISRGTEIYLLGAVDREKELARLGKEKANLERLVNATQAKLANTEFQANAPREIVAQEESKLAIYQQELEKINQSLK
ncbi:MAG: valine--tRNA ligase [Patescibacteria group bacterium]